MQRLRDDRVRNAVPRTMKSGLLIPAALDEPAAFNAAWFQPNAGLKQLKDVLGISGSHGSDERNMV